MFLKKLSYVDDLLDRGRRDGNDVTSSLMHHGVNIVNESDRRLEMHTLWALNISVGVVWRCRYQDTDG